MLQHIRYQYPVGQGFFHSALVQIDYSGIEYCYDCGSENIKALHSEVKRYANSHPSFDVLFLSHLDFDHVSGLDELLMLTKVDTAILPYLTDFERVYLLAEALEYGQIGSEYLRLIGDPVAWFASRGVKHIIFITGNENGDLPLDVPNDTPPFQPSGSTERFGKRIHKDTPFLSDRLSLDFDRLAQFVQSSAPNQSYSVYIVPDTHVFRLVDSSHKPVNWCFITFVHPEQDREESFREAFEQKFGTSVGPISKEKHTDINALLIEIVADADKRRSLAECYKDTFKNRNLTSMSLYSGPLILGQGMSFEYKRTYKDRTPDRLVKHDVPGWLGTGDADLKTTMRRQRFQSHFLLVLPNVLTLSIPHHGSSLSFHEDIIPSACKYCTLGASKNNPYHHPHTDVMVAVRRLNRTVFQASEEPNTLFVEEVNF